MSISGHETLISLNGTQSCVAMKEGGGKERGVGYAAVLKMYTSIKIL